MRRFLHLALALATSAAFCFPASAQTALAEPPAQVWGARYAGSIEREEWSDFASKFVTPDGRVGDTGNAGITHSEGQGYAMLLAWMAGAAGDFERVWHFTHSELQIRDDGLLSWSWEEDEIPHITDVNNATDGDILVAYALIAAGTTWDRADLYTQGLALLGSIRSNLVIHHPEFGAVLLPGRAGFDDNGALVNPSYWIGEAFLTFADADPSGPWHELMRSRDAILEASREITRSDLPPEWMFLPVSGGVAIPEDKSAVFSYNAIRVPLYEIRAGGKPSAGIAALVRRSEVIELPPTQETGRTTPLTAPGYRALASLIKCASFGSTLRARRNGSTARQDYYPAALGLLSVSAARVMYPNCISGGQ